MSIQRPKAVALLTYLLMVQATLSQRFFSGGRSLGDQQTLNYRPMYNDAKKIRKYSDQRRRYLAKHGRRL